MTCDAVNIFCHFCALHLFKLKVVFSSPFDISKKSGAINAPKKDIRYNIPNWTMWSLNWIIFLTQMNSILHSLFNALINHILLTFYLPQHHKHIMLDFHILQTTAHHYWKRKFPAQLFSVFSSLKSKSNFKESHFRMTPRLYKYPQYHCRLSIELHFIYSHRII